LAQHKYGDTTGRIDEDRRARDKKLRKLAVDGYVLNGEKYRKFVGHLDDCRRCAYQE